MPPCTGSLAACWAGGRPASEGTRTRTVRAILELQGWFRLGEGVKGLRVLLCRAAHEVGILWVVIDLGEHLVLGSIGQASGDDGAHCGSQVAELVQQVQEPVFLFNCHLVAIQQLLWGGCNSGDASLRCWSRRKIISGKIFLATHTSSWGAPGRRTLESGQCLVQTPDSLMTQSCEMSNILQGAKPSNQILPKEKRVNRDNFCT